MTPYQWTKIDPSVHTAEWFRGKGVTWLHDHGECFAYRLFAHSIVPAYARSFFIHPPLPDLLQEEMEREAKKDADRQYTAGECSAEYYFLQTVSECAFIRGAKWGLWKGKG